MIVVPAGRVLDIAQDRRYLSLWRGFLVITDTSDRSEVARVPIDDVAAVIASGHGVSYSGNLLEALAHRGTPLVLCGGNHNAVGMLLSIDGHGLQGKRFDSQLRASLPRRKQVWAELVRAKIAHQGAVLESVGAPTAPLFSLLKRVRSGDAGNVEAQAARRYWSLLFGAGFRRDREAAGVNAMLNYGYTVLRAATARAVVAAGLHPTLGVHHSNEANAMRLVDDLMEPFRPLVDEVVWQLRRDGFEGVDREVKRALGAVLYVDRQTSEGATPLIACIVRLASSLAQVYLGERKALELPQPDALVNERALPRDGAQSVVE